MENIVLRMHYRFYMIDVLVEDTDKTLLIDVINEMYDEAEKGAIALPRHPILTYSYKMKSWPLNEDSDLMEMFNRNVGKDVIDIWIGCGDEPSKVLILARRVRANRKSDCCENSDNVYVAGNNTSPLCLAPNNAINRKEKLPIMRNACKLNPTSSIVPISSTTLPKSNTKDKCATVVIGSPRRSPRFSGPDQSSPPNKLVQHSTVENVTPCLKPIDNDHITSLNDISHVTTSPTNCVSPKRSVRLSNCSPPKGDVVVQPSVEPKKIVPQFKMARTTAIRKGVYVPKIPASVIPDAAESSERVTRGMRPTYNDPDNEGEDSDASYIPSDLEGCESCDDEGLTDLEEEDNLISSLDCVDDGYDPYGPDEWSGEDGEYSGKLMRKSEMYEDYGFGNIKLKPWQLFVDKEHFKDALRDYCIQEGFFVIVVKCESNRYTAKCATVDCQWRIHASVLPDGITWAIKTIRDADHGCAGVMNKNPMANCLWVARKLLEDIRANPTMSDVTVEKLLMERFGIVMAKSSIYKMKDIALREINGGHDESYKLLPRYCEMVKLTNPGSTAVCSWIILENPQRTLQFKSVFVSFYAQFTGLIKGCRSLIGVDGTHLKGNHGGVLLSAIAMDGNNQLFPIAVGVVQSEDKDSWASFFWHLKQSLIDCERSDWTIISDRQKGIEPALEIVWPEAYRRFCARHLCANFKKEYPGILMHKLFWGVVKATSEFMFKKAMERVIEYGGTGCGRWFMDLGDKEMWAMHKFNPNICSEHNTSNFVESYNNTLGIHRCNPILSLLEGIRRIVMVTHASRQAAGESWRDDGICPKIRARLKELTQNSRTCYAFPSGNGEYEVRDGKSYLPVSLNSRTCACGQWQISGIPCKHAIRAILFAKRKPSDYVSDWFSVRVYKQAYGLSITPMPDKDQWQVFDVPELEPPTMTRSVGRPSRNRKREPGEARKEKRSVTIKCKKCGNFGHNTRTCKGGYTAREKAILQGKVTRKGVKRQRLGETSTVNFSTLNDLHSFVLTSTQPTVHGEEWHDSFTQTQENNTQDIVASISKRAKSGKGAQKKSRVTQ